MTYPSFIVHLMALLCASLPGGLFPAPAQAAPLTLRVTSAYMERHPAYVHALEPWMRQVEKAADNSLNLRYFSPNTLCSEAGMFDAVSAGAVNIAANAHGRTPGRFPLMGVLDLPMLVKNSESGSVISQELYEAWPALRKEAASARMLWHYVSAPHILHSTKPVQSLEDLRGMKIIAWAPLAVDVLKALGANPISAVPQESYLAVQRGMADGVLCPLSTLRSFKISEAVDHSTLVPLIVDSFWVAMSPNTWKNLTPEQQQAVESSLGDMPRLTGRALDEGAVAEAAILEAEGHRFHSISEEEQERWREALVPLYAQWLAQMAERGLQDAPALLEDARRRAEQ